jgi:hypothetical protein
MSLKSRILTSVLALACATPLLAQAVDGFGRDIPLSFAVEQIVPSSYSVSYAPGVNVDQRVSWRGGTSWDIVLEDMLSEHGLISEVSSTGKLRITRNERARAPQSAGLRLGDYAKPSLGPRPGSYADELRGDRPGFVFGAPGNTAPASAPVEIAPYVPPAEIKAETVAPESIVIGVGRNDVSQSGEVWLVYENSTLENTLMDWADRAGWTVIWDSSYSYPIEASAEFRGDFVSAASHLIKTMERAQPPVGGEFFKGNKVLVLTTRTDGNG